MGDLVRMGRPNRTFTEEQRLKVKTLAAVGITQDQISVVMEIAPKTLRKHFRRELACAAIEANTKVAHGLYQRAIRGDNTAAIFWMKARAGWSDQPGFRERTTAPAPPFIVQAPDEQKKAA